MPTTPNVFVSHSHLDNAVGLRLITDLRATLGEDNVWYDISGGLHGGVEWWGEIVEQITTRDVFLVILSPNALESVWVPQEMEQAHYLKVTQGKRLLPIRYQPVTFPLKLGHWARIHSLPCRDPSMDEQGYQQDVAAILADILQRRDPPPPLPPPPPERDEICITESLYRLGYRGWRMRRTGVEYIEPPVCPVVAGMFVMGSADSDVQADSDEKPQYRSLVGDFFLAKFPLTVAEYSYYAKASLNADPGQQYVFPQSHPFPQNAEWCAPEWRGKELSWQAQQARPDHPVVNITWFQATAYAAWLAETTDQPWRLPTEAEWEKAARWDEAKQVSRIYPWGDAWDKTCANTNDGGPKRTTAVGSYPSGASPCGAQDMAGNVWEWCSSLYKDHYPYDPTESEDDGRDTTSVRVLRGGAWSDFPQVARAAFRDGDDPICGGFTWGARVCLQAVGT